MCYISHCVALRYIFHCVALRYIYHCVALHTRSAYSIFEKFDLAAIGIQQRNSSEKLMTLTSLHVNEQIQISFQNRELCSKTLIVNDFYVLGN